MLRAASLAALTALILSTSSALAVPIHFMTALSGAAEFPPTGSPGTGLVEVVLDTDLNTLQVKGVFSGLTGTTTAAHIHCCALPTAGVIVPAASTFPIPLGVTSGAFDLTFDTTLATTYRAAFITANGGTTAGAEAALLTALLSSNAYFNIHTSAFGSGEIRGFLVPEPVSLSIFGFGLAGLAFLRRKRRSSTARR